MIKLQIEPYCDRCRSFEAVSNTETIYSCNEPIIVDTVVTCKHAQKCAQIEKYIKERAERNGHP